MLSSRSRFHPPHPDDFSRSCLAGAFHNHQIKRPSGSEAENSGYDFALHLARSRGHMAIPNLTRSPVRNRALAHLSLIFLISAGQSGCRQDLSNDRQMPLKVGSPDFRQGENIPRQFTCDGADVSPALSWQSPPPNTKSLVLVLRDSDSLFGSFVHWILYNLPPGSNNIAEALPQPELLPDGSKQGVNGDDAIGYAGPCPPGKSPHRYVFTVYALDTMLTLPPRADKRQLTKAMKGHILAAGQLMGRYHR